jgi:hypothetical protein
MSEKKYSYSLNKLHENILIKPNKKGKKNLDLVEILQIHVKQRRPIRYNIISSRDAQSLYWVFIRASGYRMSSSLNYKFEFYADHRAAIRKMRRLTSKLIKKRNFKFVSDPTYMRIKAFDTITTGLEDGMQFARAHAPTPDGMAAAAIHQLSPAHLTKKAEKVEDHMNIL